MNRLKRAIKKLLDKIAEQNKAVFGNQRLDCCDMNKPSARKQK
ncbi:LDCC motif putative metal-binding protein [Fusibacter ferrireducens]|nr:LDCC motif putative metal-binding protein [Fusibacter ferrireducens]